MLPTQQEAQEIAGRYWFDLGAQAVDRVAVDARQQTALAPLLLASRVGETTSHGKAFDLQASKRRRDRLPGEAKRSRQLSGSHRAEALQAAAHDLGQGLLRQPGLRPQ